jgi:polyisoprenoid-binding protein YceI
MRHIRPLLLLGLLVLGQSRWDLPIWGRPARAEQIVLSPAGGEIGFRAYGLGLIPVDGKFTRFHGVMRYDAAQPGKCQVMLEIDPDSLVMEDASLHDEVRGPDFMDVTHYPDMAFDGVCQGEMVTGTLRMHGQVHPFTLELSRSGASVLAKGRLNRATWGITAHPWKVGPTIRIAVQLPNPVTGPHT